MMYIKNKHKNDTRISTIRNDVRSKLIFSLLFPSNLVLVWQLHFVQFQHTLLMSSIHLQIARRKGGKKMEILQSKWDVLLVLPLSADAAMCTYYVFKMQSNSNTKYGIVKVVA